MSQQQTFCSVCDHQIIAGVACDGQPDECPYHAEHSVKRHQAVSFAAIIDSVTGSREIDAVKGID